MIKANNKVVQWRASITDMLEYFQNLHDKKEESYDSKSDKWQESEKGEEAQEDIGLLDDLILNLEQVEIPFDELYEF